MAVLERSNARQGPRSVGHVPGEVGIWVFIVGDLLAFTVMFVAFLVDERRHELTYASAQQLLSVPLGAANTVLLLTGSLFVVAGVRAARAATGRAQHLGTADQAAGSETSSPAKARSISLRVSSTP